MDVPHDLHPRRRIPTGMRFADWAAPDDWRLRRFDWPAFGQPRGSLLFLGGRGDFLEKYLEAFGDWHRAGWAVAGFDWRGQGGSGRLLTDPLVCHISDFEPLLDDLEAFVRSWRAATAPPHVAIAHSMGAHLLLRLLAERRAALGGAVLLAPMMGLAVKRLPTALARAAAAAAIGLGLGERRIWARDIGNVGGRMTSCPDRLADKLWWKAERPDIASGAPSWGWLAAACRSIARLEAADLGAIGVPMLVIASRRDPVIDVAAACRAAVRLRCARLHLVEATGHELLREADRLRLPVMARIAAFLDSLAAAED